MINELRRFYMDRQILRDLVLNTYCGVAYRVVRSIRFKFIVMERIPWNCLLFPLHFLHAMNLHWKGALLDVLTFGGWDALFVLCECQWRRFETHVGLFVFFFGLFLSFGDHWLGLEWWVFFWLVALHLTNDWVVERCFSESLFLPGVSLGDLIIVFVFLVHFLLFEWFLGLNLLLFFWNFVDFDLLGALTSFVLMRFLVLEFLLDVVEVILIEMCKDIGAWFTFEDNFLLRLWLVFCFGFLTAFRIVKFGRWRI